MNLNQVTIPVTDIDKSIAFYELLGLKLIVHSHDRYARFECSNGATFSLHVVEQLITASCTTVYFEREDLDEYISELQKNGIQFKQLLKNQTWLWREAHLTDPDNNPLIIYYAGKNRLNPPWRLG